MTAAPVMSITEELIAELERDFSALTDPVEFGTEMVRKAATICALLAERAELKRRAAQGDWLIKYMASEREDLDDTLMMGCSENQPDVLRSIIDAERSIK